MYLGEEAFIFFKAAYDFWGARFRLILLTETPQHLITRWAQDAGIPNDIIEITQQSHQHIPQWLAKADFAFNPQKPIPSKRFGTPIKDGEYWAMGLPIVILPEISADSEITRRHNVGVIWERMEYDLAQGVCAAMDELLRDPEVPARCVQAAKKYRSMEIAQKVYDEVYQRLIT
jgi:hypothetical protein